MMARSYKIPYSGVTVASGTELVSGFNNTSGVELRICRIVLSNTDVTLATAQGLKVLIERLSPTVTQGTTGGTSVTPGKDDPGDSAAVSVWYKGATAVSTTNGSIDQVLADGCYLYAGRDIVMSQTIVVPYQWLFRIRFPNAPSGSPTIDGWIEATESGAYAS